MKINIEKRIKQVIANSKYLSNEKYFKMNKVSVAAWDSWAARGQAGGCGVCHAKNYIYTVYNIRHTTKYHSWSSNPVSPQMCSQCYQELENQLNYSFRKW